MIRLDEGRASGALVGRMAIIVLGVTMVAVLARTFYEIPAYGRLIVHDEFNVRTAAQGCGFLAGIWYENWNLPMYLLPLLNGVDSVIAILLGVMTHDWRAAKVIQYAVAVAFVIVGWWWALGEVLGRGKDAAAREAGLFKAVLTAAYVLSPYSLMQMNNGTFWSFSVFFAMAVLPFILVKGLQIITGAGDEARESIGFGFGMLCGVACWWLPFAPVVMLSAAVPCVLFLPLARGNKALAWPSFLLGLGIAWLPVFVAAYYTFVNRGFSADFLFRSNATFELIQGGILTPFLQRFSWVLYTNWTPKAVHAYFARFDDRAMQVLYLAFLAVLAYSALVARGRPSLRRLLVALLLVYLSAAFLSKGASFPFGWLFAGLEAITGGVIRTPDTKFGMVATASMLLACGVAGRLNRVVLGVVCALCAAYLCAAIPLYYSGELVNPSGSARYAVTLSPDEEESLARLNAADQGRVLVLPGTGTESDPAGGYSYVGREYLVPDIARPIVALHDGAMGGHESLMLARRFVDGMDLRGLRQMGIRFVLIRKSQAPARYRDFRRASDGAQAKILVDGSRVALFELTGAGSPFEIVDRHGAVVPATLRRTALVPFAFVVQTAPYEWADGPLSARADVLASQHWVWLPMDADAGIATGALRALVHAFAGSTARASLHLSRVGLAEWALPQPATSAGGSRVFRWLVIHTPNVILCGALLLTALMGMMLLVRKILAQAARKLRNANGARPIIERYVDIKR